MSPTNANTLSSIIVLGSFYSGSGAVYDYLAGRSDICDPLSGREMYIIQNPYGILPFYTTAYESYYPFVATEALDKLEWTLKFAGYKKRSFRYGCGLSNIIPNYQEKVSQYIEELTEIEFPFASQFFSMKKKWFHAFLDFVMSRRKKTAVMQRLPVPRHKFLEITRDFLNRLLENQMHDVSSDTKAFILNQAGSYWCPEKTSLFFPNCYVITVTRDPRDQFAELKKAKGLKDASVFVRWYRSVMQMRSPSYYNKVLDVQFEQFVQDNDVEKKKLCRFLNIDLTAPSSYNPKLSSENIGKYKYLLTDDEARYIEKEIPEYLFI